MIPLPRPLTRPAYHRRNSDGVRGKELHNRRRRRQFMAAACRGAFTFGVTVNTYKRAAISAPPKGTGPTAIGSEGSCNNKAGR
jgi:hypothetical protein